MAVMLCLAAYSDHLSRIFKCGLTKNEWVCESMPSAT
jgi:hypothetical protein